MKRVVICLLILLALGSFANADAVGEVRKAIEANYSAIAKAFVKKDYPAMSGFMTEDFQAIPPQGKAMTREEVVKDFAVQRERLTDINWTKKIKKIDLQGDDAKLVVDGRLSAHIDFGDHKPHTFLLNATSEDEWVKVGGLWKLKLSKTTVFQAKIDGRKPGAQ